MVSQEFMTILNKQCNPPSTYSSIDTSSSSSGRTVNVGNHESRIKDKEDLTSHKEEESDSDYVTIKEEEHFSEDSTCSPLTVKCEPEDFHSVEIKSEKGDSDNIREPHLPQARVNNLSYSTVFCAKKVRYEEEEKSNLETSQIKTETESSSVASLQSDTAGKNKNIAVFSSDSVLQHKKEAKPLRHPSKRPIKKKTIFDPSDGFTFSRRKRTPTIDGNGVRSISRISDDGEQSLKFHEDSDSSESEIWTDSLKLKCVYCGKLFKRRTEMRYHLMTHTGERPHRCMHCSNAYRYRWRLKQHMRTHTKNLPYQCPYCSYCGNRKDYLSSHVKRRHNKKLSNCSRKIEEHFQSIGKSN